MAGPLLETKLHVPRRRRGVVVRPRLDDRLRRGRDAALTLVSAPAGFGKTTLLTEWLATGAGPPPAWVSLDARDDDPVRFWSYVLAALQRVAPGIGAEALALLQSPQAPLDAVLAALLNDLAAVPDDVVLVLDDYHLVEGRDVQDGMAFLLEHLPPRVRLVIAGRADPPLPLARMRARGELVEIRAADLRFTPEEAAAYLDGMLGPGLAARDVAALEERTEGWIAALQLAALSMQGRADVAGFVAGFAGDDRYVVDYLAEEVLQRQPGHVRDFLLATSVLDRLTGDLCDAVTGRSDGRLVLEALERGNLFVVPLDDRRRWYRYHHLFADVLRVRLLDEQPGRAPELHRRASAWHEQHGDRAEAVHHALSGADWSRAAGLVELELPALRRDRREATLRRWLDALPDEVFRVRPVLGVGYVSSRMVAGELAGVDERLRDAERWLDPPDEDRAPGMVVVDEAQFRALPTAIAMYRAGQALLLGDVAGTLAAARRALDLVGEDDPVGRGSAAALLALAHWTSGDLEEAHRWYSVGAAALEEAGHLSDVLGCALALADIRIAQGRLAEAMSTYERGLRLTAGRDGPVLRGAADMHVGMSEVLVERNDLGAARAHLRTCAELGAAAGLPQNPYRLRVATARVRTAEGDLAGAVAELDEAEQRYVGDYFPEVRPVPAVRVRVELARGDLGRALGWARERGLSADDDPGYLREYEHLTLARVLLAARRDLVGVDRLLARLLTAAEEGRRTGSVIETLVLQTLAAQARDDAPAALPPLRRALSLAEPEGAVRVFLDEGPALAGPLRAVASSGEGRDLARRLLAATDRAGDPRPRQQGLVDPLSARELEVLRLLGSDLSGPRIAGELFVSLNTLRTHTKAIYAKLGVNDRRAAVRRAADLHLLTPGRDGVPDR